MMGFWDGNGISWTICKQSAPNSRQITTPTVPAPHHSVFTEQMLFLTPSQQCQSTAGTKALQALVHEIDKYQWHRDILIARAHGSG